MFSMSDNYSDCTYHSTLFCCTWYIIIRNIISCVLFSLGISAGDKSKLIQKNWLTFIVVPLIFNEDFIYNASTISSQSQTIIIIMCYNNLQFSFACHVSCI